MLDTGQVPPEETNKKKLRWWKLLWSVVIAKVPLTVGEVSIFSCILLIKG